MSELRLKVLELVAGIDAEIRVLSARVEELRRVRLVTCQTFDVIVPEPNTRREGDSVPNSVHLSPYRLSLAPELAEGLAQAEARADRALAAEFGPKSSAKVAKAAKRADSAVPSGVPSGVPATTGLTIAEGILQAVGAYPGADRKTVSAYLSSHGVEAAEASVHTYINRLIKAGKLNFEKVGRESSYTLTEKREAAEAAEAVLETPVF